MKAAEAAKGVVTEVETALSAAKDKLAKATPEKKGDIQKEIDYLQAVLDTAKKDAADKEAQAKIEQQRQEHHQQNHQKITIKIGKIKLIETLKSLPK